MSDAHMWYFAENSHLLKNTSSAKGRRVRITFSFSLDLEFVSGNYRKWHAKPRAVWKCTAQHVAPPEVQRSQFRQARPLVRRGLDRSSFCSCVSQTSPQPS